MPYVKPAPGNEVVIGGISGRYPSCQNVKELQEKIMDKQDLLVECSRWAAEFEDLPNRTGEVSNLEKFDAAFFGIHTKQVATMDPMSRILLELTYEAVVDAGYNPIELRGKNIAVVVGISFSESERLLLTDRGKQSSGFVATGCSRAMIANRISFWLGVHGPSYSVDAACSSSGIALEHCYRLIMHDDCDGAIVGGANICLHPYVTLHYARLGVLSPDGRCKSFDADADGYVRSDGMCVLFLQRAKDAKRVYATVVHCKVNCDGSKEKSITYPSSRLQSELLTSFYNECAIPLNALNYLEAHGTGTKVGDPEEIFAVDSVLCKGRTTPLRIGCIKSNIGHCESVSGLCAVSKVIIAMETGIIPPNINYKRPRDSLKAIIDGRVQVITEKTPWELGYAALNSFGFGGVNAHALLQSNAKEKVNNGAPNDDLSRLVVVSGRTEASVNTLLDSVEEVKLDVEYIRLLHDVHAYNTPKHLYRGYTIVGSKHTMTKIREVTPFKETTRPIWFVFSGMGSQWPNMGKMLMRFPVFAKAVEKCDAILRPRGIDIVHIISANDEAIFSNIINCFVGIVAIQIGLVDLLTAAGIVPDNIIGHSVGELGCAYSDGCFTAEQTILAAYARGLASINTEIIHGAMAAIGLGAKVVEEMCPADIDVACHNSSTSSTVSGPLANIENFIATLAEKNIFAKKVATGNVAYHSRYITKAGPRLLNYLTEIIPEPKPRSQKWLSTSVLESDWFTEAATYSSAEYHTNNFLKPVLFEETTMHIPQNAICIEIAPHGYLQPILKQSLAPETTNVSLTFRGHNDNAEFFAQALGKLYNLGLQPKIANLYPPVSFPVSRGTPMIAPLIKWDHTNDWYVAYMEDHEKISSGERTLEISTRDQLYEYMSGYVIDGRNLIPPTGYISLIWETVALIKGFPYTSLSIIFEDIRFHRVCNLAREDGITKLTIMINKGTGYFEILDNDVAVVTGKMRTESNPASEMASTNFLSDLVGKEDLDSEDFYKVLKIHGYEYAGLFQSMKSATIDGTKGRITWRGNYAAFIDNMLQLKMFHSERRSLYMPTSIRKLIIDTNTHLKMLESMKSDEKEIPAYVYKDLDLIVSGGVQLYGLITTSMPRRSLRGIPVLEEYKFVAHRDRVQVSLEEMVILSSHLALETQPAATFKTLEVMHDEDEIAADIPVSPFLLRCLKNIPLIHPITYLVASEQNNRDASLLSEINLIKPEQMPMDGSIFLAVGQNLLAKEKEQKLKQILTSLRAGGFIMTAEDLMNNATICQASNLFLDIIIEKCHGKKTLLLLRKHLKEPDQSEVVSVNSEGLDWLEEVKTIMKRTSEEDVNSRVILVTQADRECGLMGMVTCLRKEPGGEVVRAVIIQDDTCPKFGLKNRFYAQHLQLGLPINIVQNGAWGSYRYLPLLPQKPILTYHAFVDQLIPCNLTSLKWLEGPIRPADRPEDQILTVYTGLSFKDVLVATGKIAEGMTGQRKNTTSGHAPIGFEYSGMTARGVRIMGFLTTSGMSNVYYPEAGITWKVPDHWSLEDAATVPVAYGIACYAFYVVDNIKKGEKILVHSGAGGVGQAAIQIALQEGLEVFTTVGTPDKRQFIRERFPVIPADHIGNSRDSSFELMIIQQTNGRGVDVVLNSLSGNKLLASVRCLARFGRFLEIGKYDIVANNALNMLVFTKEISFRSITLNLKLSEESIGRTNSLKRKFQDFLDSGRIQPIKRKVFTKDAVESAIRYIATGEHIGKVLLKLCDEKGPYNKPILAHPRFYCTKSGSYIIVGGLGGFGLEVAEWLNSRGARNLVLVSRRGITTGYQKLKIHQWRTDGNNVNVIKVKEDWKRKDCEYILKEAAKLGPVDGIFNLAVQLKDAILANQTVETFEKALTPKVGITKLLDQVSRSLCPVLRYFVVFSSGSGGRGNVGQTNYGYGNTVMERICERRVTEGLPGLAIQWGAVGDVGIGAEMQKNNREFIVGGTLQQKIFSCMEEMEKFLLQNQPVVSCMIVAEKRRGNSFAQNPLEAVLNGMGTHDCGMKNIESVDKDIPLTELGMDSILAIDVKQTLEQQFDVFLTAAEIRTLSYRKLIALSAYNAEGNTNMGGCS